MLPSMFNLDHRLAELHQVGSALRAERQVRDAATPAAGRGRSLGEAIRTWLVGPQASSRPSRLASH